MLRGQAAVLCVLLLAVSCVIMVVDAGSGAGFKSHKSKRPKSPTRKDAAQTVPAPAPMAVRKVSSRFIVAREAGPKFTDDDKERHALIKEELIDYEENRQYIEPPACVGEGPAMEQPVVRDETEDVDATLNTETEQATAMGTKTQTETETETESQCPAEKLLFERSRTNENWLGDPRCSCEVKYSNPIDGIELNLIPLPDGLHMYHGSSLLGDNEIPGSFKSHPGFRPSFFTSRQSAAGYATSTRHNTLGSGESPRLHEFSIIDKKGAESEESKQRYVIDLTDADNYFALKALLANYVVNPKAEATVPGYTALAYDFSFRCKRDTAGRVTWNRFSNSNYDPTWAAGICMLIQDKKIPVIGAGARAFNKENTFVVMANDKMDEEAAFHPEIILCQPKYHLVSEGSFSVQQLRGEAQVQV